MFTFFWQFVIILTICIIAYGRILSVLRRQGKVMPTPRRTITVATTETVVGPSKGLTQVETTNQGLTNKTTERDRSVREGKAKGDIGTQSQTAFSKARVNVIRTIISILVCFVVCLFPHDCYSVYKTLKVFIHL